MKIAILGTGDVGRTLASKLVELGHEVTLGARTADHAGAAQWAEASGPSAGHGTFADATTGAALVFNCVGGQHALAALGAANDAEAADSAGGLAGKIVIDVSNPLDFSEGFPPKLFTAADGDSLAERIQAAFPQARVVKALNTVANAVMVDPGRVPGVHSLLICGDDADAKATVTTLLEDGFGWQDVIDLGGIENARGTEAWLLLWTRLYRALGTGDFNLHVARGG